MSKQFFRLNEGKEKLEMSLPDFLERLNFNDDGLIPAIVQQYDTRRVLMMAWMNREAITQTIVSQRLCYWSRSRQKFWLKGEESGHVQHLKAMFADCDGDTLLVSVEQVGFACHTQRESCFYWCFDVDAKKVHKTDT